MKKMSFILAVFATLSCVAHAGPKYSDSKVAIVKIGEVFKVIYKGQFQYPVKLAIIDSDGKEVFNEKILCTGGFIRPYNFSRLPKGNYQLRIIDPSGEYLRDIHFDDECTNEQLQNKPMLCHISKLKGDENKYMVVIPCQNQKDFAIRIYDQDEQIIFSENQRIEKGFAKVYHLKNLQGATIRLTNEAGEEMCYKTDEQ